MFFAKRNYRPSQPSGSRRLFYQNNGTPVTQDTAMTASAWYRGMIYLSSQLSKLPFKVKSKDLSVLDNDRVTKIIDLSPNHEQTSMMFRMFMTQTAAGHGNAYAEIERDMLQRPVALWSIAPSHCEPFRDEDSNLRYRIVGGAIDGSGGSVILKPRDIFHIPNLHTKDGLTGMGITEFAKETLGISLGANVFSNGLFANGGMPSGVLTVPGNLSDEAFERIAAGWKEKHGNRKVGGTAMLEEGMKYEALMLNPEALQLMNTKKFNVYEVARFLGVPPQKLFDSDSQTFKNVEQVNIQVANDTIDPWAKVWEQEVDKKLLNNRHGGKNSQFDLYDLFRGDMDTRSKYFKDMFGIGAITPNQIRAKEGMSPYDKGEDYYIATNNFTPISRLDDVIDSQIAPKQETKVDEEIVNYLKKK